MLTFQLKGGNWWSYALEGSLVMSMSVSLFIWIYSHVICTDFVKQMYRKTVYIYQAF